jgi:hypothetical protein
MIHTTVSTGIYMLFEWMGKNYPRGIAAGVDGLGALAPRRM